MLRRFADTCCCATLCLALECHAQELPLVPGRYEIEVRVSLPNVQYEPPPKQLTLCLTAANLRSGRALFVQSENPLKQCGLMDYRVASNSASYRIECPGPNRGSAVALFEATSTAYRGTIKMNMGGKNMTMTEIQTGRRVGECR